MPPRSEVGVSNETTNNNQQDNSSLTIVNNSNLIMSNSNQNNSNHPGVHLNNGLHQPSSISHFPPGSLPAGANPYAQQLPSDPYGANKQALPPNLYAQAPHWQGNAYRPQMTPANSAYANSVAFSPYQNPHNRLPTNYNPQNPYMNYPPMSPQNSSMMPPPPNNYPKMSPQMYQPRSSSQPLMPPNQHSSYPPQGHSLHQYPPHQYPQNAYNKMPYFNGFLPYPQQPLPYGYPTNAHPDNSSMTMADNHHLSNLQQQQQQIAQKQLEFNGNQQSHELNNSNQEQQTNENALNNSLNKNSTLTNQQSSVTNTAIEEASQASASSSHTEERNEMSKKQSYLSAIGSPGAVSMNSIQDELDSSNASWPRTPASPAVESSKNKKADSLQKLYEMSDEPERKIFLDKLVQFNSENGVTLNSCPHISKSLIDLYKLYLYVKERGGFAETTKKKLWKECANLCKMPIASTTSYTLRKQYIKHLLPFECKFDRNGIDPQKLLASVESASKKKGANKNAMSPQSVDNNSQSSYPQSSTPQLNTSNNKPHSPAQSPGLQSPNFQNVPTSNIYQQQLQQPQQQQPPQQNAVAPSLIPNQSPYHFQQQQQQQNQQQQINDENYQRKMGYKPNSNLPPVASNLPPQQSNKPIDYYQNYDAYNRNKNLPPQMQNQFSPRPPQMQPGALPNQNYPQPTDNYQNLIRGSSQLAERLLKSKPPSPASQANYQQPPLNHQNYSLPNQQMKSPIINNNSSYPKRHPDFNKTEQQSQFPPPIPSQPNNYPPSSQYIHQPKGYPNANEFLSNSFLNNYNKQQPPPHQQPPSHQQLPSHQQPPQQQLSSIHRPSSAFDQKPYPINGPNSFYTAPQPQTVSISNSLAPINQIREIQFPPESIEAIKPIFVKRKKLTSKDLMQIDPWKLMMSLKSGLLAETTWALDVLSILLHDDNTYMYFSLQNLPGLLELLIEHFKLYLSEIFKDLFKDIELEHSQKENGHSDEPSFEETFIKKVLEANEKFKKKFNSEIEAEINGSLENGVDSNNEDNDDESIDKKSKNDKFKRMKLTKLNTLSYHLDHKQIVLNKCENYTLKNRKGLPVYFVDDDECLFINDFNQKWDKLNKKSIETDNEHWKKTFFSSTDFIQRTFQPPETNLQFSKKEKSSREEQTNGNGAQPNQNESSENNQEQKDDEDEQETITYPRFREKVKLKRFLEDNESECYMRDSPPLCSSNDYRESIARKCICFSTLIRNLSFVTGNDVELSKNTGLLLILGRLLLLHHKHLEKKSSKINLTSLDDSLFNENTDLDDLNRSITEDNVEIDDNESNDEWSSEALHFIRENALVTITNISGTLNLSKYNEEISLPILSGLLHWAVCTSSVALDNFKTSSICSISPSRLALECLSRLSILESNVDLMLTTPPHNRDTAIFETLVNHLRRNEDQTVREFALVLLYNFATADPSISRTIALTTDAIQQLLVFIELAEQNALNFINQNGLHIFKDNPECMGTTKEMIKRAALCLRCLAKVPENSSLFFTYQQRLVQLVMSSVFDQKITSIIADICYEISIDESCQFKFLKNDKNNKNETLIKSMSTEIS